MHRSLRPFALLLFVCLLALTNAHAQQATGIIETIAGTAPFQSPANATSIGIGSAGGVVADSAGNTYIATNELGVVLKVGPSGIATVYAGVPLPTGPAGDSGDGGPATAAHLTQPTALALDTNGNLYIAELVSEDGVSLVRKVDAQTGTISTVAGTTKYAQYTEGGAATSTPLSFIYGLAVDTSHHLFVYDSSLIVQIDLATGLIHTAIGAGTGTVCKLSATQACPANQVEVVALGNRNGVMAAAGTHVYFGVYAANADNGSNGVLDFDESTGLVQLIAGGADVGTSASFPADGQYYNIFGVAANPAGDVFFWDANQQHIIRLDRTTRVPTIAAGTGGFGPTGDGGAATSAKLGALEALSCSPQGQVLLRDSRTIRTFSVGGEITTIAGDLYPNLFGDGGPSLAAGLDYPNDVTFDAEGNLLIADEGNQSIRRVDAHTGKIVTLFGYSLGPSAPVFKYTPSPSLPALSPSSLTTDGKGNLFVQDFAYLLAADMTTGSLSSIVPPSAPASSFLDPDGRILSDGNGLIYADKFESLQPGGQVIAVNSQTGAQTIVAGIGFGSYLSGTGDGGPATQATLVKPVGLALDGQSKLYIADAGTSSIRVVDLNTGIIETLATLIEPHGKPLLLNQLVDDGAGHLFVADLATATVRQIDKATGTFNTIAGSEMAGYSGDGGPASSATLNHPTSVAVDANGNLFIADQDNQRIRRVLLHPTKLNATLTASTNTTTAGSPVTLSASYSNLSFGFAPTGSVQFLSGSTVLGTAPLATNPDVAGNYVAALTTSALPTGSDAITAVYAGDVHYAAITTPTVMVSVGGAAPTYTVAAAPAALTIKQGGSGTTTLTVTPQNGFAGTVTFSCGSGLPTGVICSFTPASVTPQNGAAATTTLTVSTTAATAAVAPLAPAWLPRGGAVLAVLLLGLPVAGRRRWTAALGLVVLFALMVGCGGSSGSSTAPAANTSATPPGNYTLNVVATAGSGASATRQPLNVTITVTQ